uniref:Uncharacterized protein n=1 Tax=Russula compacta TaxID=40490 RepID=A0A2S0U3L0_9AGAM|nr:hypothetical protein [Russula compacta]AWB36083.1 hypothetical protein [Russula compacta]
MIDNLISNNNLFDYGIYIGCGLILSYSVYYLIRSNYIANLPNNRKVLTNQEIETINNENMVSNSNIEDFITDSDFDTESDYENISAYDSASSADFYEIINDPDFFFMPSFVSKFKHVEFIMPDVDFNICPIEELKLFEFCSLYSTEMAEHSVTQEEMMELICLFSEKDLATNWINDLLLTIIELL